MKEWKHKKLMRNMLFIGLILGAIIVWGMTEIYGNPILHRRVNRDAKAYVEEHYGEMNLQMSKASYNWKMNEYIVSIKSPTSIDTKFYLAFSKNGQFRYDTYETDVLEKWNTYMRIEEDYRAKTDEVLDDIAFPYGGDIRFGEMVIRDEQKAYGEIYGIKLDQLELDKEYDVMELAKEAGHLVIYVEDEEVTSRNMANILLGIKEYLDERAINFYAINLTLQEPRQEDVPIREQSHIEIEDFKYEDIYEEGLESRVDEAIKELQAYYYEADQIKEEERLQATS